MRRRWRGIAWGEQRGMTVIEAVVAAAVMGLIVVVSLALYTPVLHLKKQMDSDTGLNLVATELRNCVANDTAWSNTVNDPRNSPATDCLNYSGNLHGPTPVCTPPPTPGQNGPQVRLMSQFQTATGQSVDCIGGQSPVTSTGGPYDTASPTDGFAPDGAVCHAFNGAPGAGNTQCPFHINVAWEALCPPSPTPCTNPLVHVYGTMVFNGGKGDRPPPNTQLQRLSIDMVRGRADQQRRFTLLETTPAGQPSASRCNGIRLLNSLQSDTGAYIQGQYTDGSFELRPGTYNCEISGPAFQVGTHQLVLVDLDRKLAKLIGSSEFAPPGRAYAMSRSVASGSFTIQTATHMAVEHLCQASVTPPAAGALGLPAGLNPAAEIYAMMTCAALTR